MSSNVFIGISDCDVAVCYLYAEAVVYDTLRRLMELSGADGEPEEIIKGLTVAVSVDDTTKISIK